MEWLYLSKEETLKDLEEAVPTGEKIWLIFDGRARMMDTDDCAVYEAFSSHDGTLEDVKKQRDKEWKDGVIFEYDEVKGKLGNHIVKQTLIG